MAAGRPTTYSSTILKKAREYLASCEDEEVQVLKQANAQKGYEMYDNKLRVKLPSVEGLVRAHRHNIPRDSHPAAMPGTVAEQLHAEILQKHH